MGPSLQIKRAYDPPSPEDGARYLVDLLWPRGLTTEQLALTAWLKGAAPSAALRRWFGHQPERWPGFRRRYRTELRHNEASLEVLRQAMRRRPVTLVYAARDAQHNQARVLQEYLLESPSPRLSKPQGARTSEAQRHLRRSRR